MMVWGRWTDAHYMAVDERAGGPQSGVAAWLEWTHSRGRQTVVLGRILKQVWFGTG